MTIEYRLRSGLAISSSYLLANPDIVTGKILLTKTFPVGRQTTEENIIPELAARALSDELLAVPWLRAPGYLL